MGCKGRGKDKGGNKGIGGWRNGGKGGKKKEGHWEDQGGAVEQRTRGAIKFKSLCIFEISIKIFSPQLRLYTGKNPCDRIIKGAFHKTLRVIIPVPKNVFKIIKISRLGPTETTGIILKCHGKKENKFTEFIF